MFSKYLKTLFSIMILMAFVSTMSAQEFKYVGVKTCKMCHKKDKTGNQFKVWKGSKHAEAFATLKSEKAAAVAKEKGIKGSPAEAAECLKCHAPAHNVDAKLIGKKYKQEEGVQCESCHGPGSKYKSKKTMQDPVKAAAKGLKLYADEAAVKALCVTCHNDESPTFKSFDFAAMWAKIKHPKPSK